MNNSRLSLYTSPYLIWMSLFFIIPTLIVAFVSFIDQSSWNTIITFLRNFQSNIKEYGFSNTWHELTKSFSDLTFTCGAYEELWEPRVKITIIRTFIISLITSILCIILSIPTAYFISQSKYKDMWLLILILPFWTNFLIRIFAWIKILGNNGLINNTLLGLNIITKPIPLLYNNFAVTVLCIYICLPFAIIPIFSAIEKFDQSLWEVSEDLGAKPWQSFCYIFIPQISNGISSAFVFSFINTFGNYAIAKLVGGQNAYVLGSLVVHNATVGRNMPLAATISTVICFLSLILILFNSMKKKELE